MQVQLRTVDEVRGWLAEDVARRAGLTPTDIDPERDLADYALDSSEFVELALELEVWLGFEFDMTVLWDETTLEDVTQAVFRLQTEALGQMTKVWGAQASS